MTDSTSITLVYPKDLKDQPPTPFLMVISGSLVYAIDDFETLPHPEHGVPSLIVGYAKGQKVVVMPIDGYWRIVRRDACDEVSIPITFQRAPQMGTVTPDQLAEWWKRQSEGDAA